MNTFLDGQEIKPHRPTLAAGLSLAVQAAEATGRIIVEAWVDGRPLGEGELENPSDVPGSVLKLELISAEPRELVATTLLDGVAALDELVSIQHDAGVAIQKGQGQESMEAIRRVVETWTGVRAILERGSAILGTDLTAASPMPFAPLAQSLSQNLATLKDSLQRQDWSVLSDCLAYELVPQAKAWRDALAGMAAAISPAAPSSAGGSPE